MYPLNYVVSGSVQAQDVDHLNGYKIARIRETMLLSNGITGHL
jgi:hypothetical protein